MPMNKPHIEFQRLDMAGGWQTPPGYPQAIKQKVLASDLDEVNKTGSRTRLLRFDPGDMRTRMHQDAFPGEDISDRPEPEVAATALRRLLAGAPSSGRYRAAEWMEVPV